MKNKREFIAILWMPAACFILTYPVLLLSAKIVILFSLNWHVILSEFLFIPQSYISTIQIDEPEKFVAYFIGALTFAIVGLCALIPYPLLTEFKKSFGYILKLSHTTILLLLSYTVFYFGVAYFGFFEKLLLFFAEEQSSIIMAITLFFLVFYLIYSCLNAGIRKLYSLTRVQHDREVC